MITKEMAVGLRYQQELWHNTAVNKDGTPVRARVNGRCTTWKTRPDDWRLPMKHGLKNTFYLGVMGGDMYGPGGAWSLPERWAIERHWKEGT